MDNNHLAATRGRPPKQSPAGRDTQAELAALLRYLESPVQLPSRVQSTAVPAEDAPRWRHFYRWQTIARLMGIKQSTLAKMLTPGAGVVATAERLDRLYPFLLYYPPPPEPGAAELNQSGLESCKKPRPASSDAAPGLL